MTRLRPQLEPGETLLHRGGAVFALWRVLAWLAAFFGLLVFALYLDDLKASGFDPLAFLPPFLLAALAPLTALAFILAVVSGFGEGCTVTDRRVLVRRGLFDRRRTEFRFAEIEHAAVRNERLKLSGGGRRLELRLRRHQLNAGLLSRILPRWFPEAGRPMARLGRILEPGERVVFRYPPAWTGRVLPVIAGAAILVLAWDLWGNLAGGEGSGLVFSLTGIYLMLAVLAAPPAGRQGWWIVVTDRRLLRRIDWDWTRYEEIPLAEIEAGWRTRFAQRLAASHEGEELDIPVRGKAAARVLAVIEGAG
jgi:hypothetical protein